MWESARERRCLEQSPDLLTAALTRPITKDDPHTFKEFVRRVVDY
jgi:hypothetical protein